MIHTKDLFIFHESLDEYIQANEINRAIYYELSARWADSDKEACQIFDDAYHICLTVLLYNHPVYIYKELCKLYFWKSFNVAYALLYLSKPDRDVKLFLDCVDESNSNCYGDEFFETSQFIDNYKDSELAKSISFTPRNSKCSFLNTEYKTIIENFFDGSLEMSIRLLPKDYQLTAYNEYSRVISDYGIAGIMDTVLISKYPKITTAFYDEVHGTCLPISWKEQIETGKFEFPNKCVALHQMGIDCIAKENSENSYAEDKEITYEIDAWDELRNCNENDLNRVERNSCDDLFTSSLKNENKKLKEKIHDLNEEIAKCHCQIENLNSLQQDKDDGYSAETSEDGRVFKFNIDNKEFSLESKDKNVRYLLCLIAKKAFNVSKLEKQEYEFLQFILKLDNYKRLQTNYNKITKNLNSNLGEGRLLEEEKEFFEAICKKYDL